MTDNKQTKSTTISEIPTMGFVRLPQILAVMPICAATWWNWVKAGKAPRAYKLGPRVTAWKASDIRAMLEASN